MAAPPSPEQIAGDLAPLIAGEVRADPVNRALYATAACIFRVPPLAVVWPRSPEDVAAVLGYARAAGVPVTPRGGGSGLCGNSVNAAIILDASRHLTGVTVEADGTVTAQAGATLGAVDAALGTVDRRFGPDPSSRRYCTIGGMVANNAGGAHSLRFGAMTDVVEEMEVALADGSLVRLHRAMDWAALPPPVRAACAAIRPWRDRMGQWRPDVPRHASGYNVWDTWGEAPEPATVNPISLLVGSEGTLGCVTAVRCRAFPRPAATGTLLLALEDVDRMEEVLPVLLDREAAVVEVMDDHFLRRLPGGPWREIPHGTRALLIAEWEGTPAEVQARVGAVTGVLEGPAGRGVTAHVADDPEARARVWDMRCTATAALSRGAGPARPTRFIEDGIVHPRRLVPFLRGVRRILERHRLPVPIFGHAGDGNLHINPPLDLRNPAHRERMTAIADAYTDLVLSLGGSLTGEHGDGRLRTPFLPRAFGALTRCFADVKAALAPTGILNPGIIVPDRNGNGAAPGLTDHRRFGRTYRVGPTETIFDQARYREEIEKCHGCGKCRDYCPTFQESGDEAASARAKANLLTAVLTGELSAPAAFEDPRFRETIDFCVDCKQCLTTCPTQVDIPLLAEAARTYFPHTWRESARDAVLTGAQVVSRLGCLTRPVSSASLRWGWLRGLGDRVLGLSAARALPRFSAPPAGMVWAGTRPAGGRRVAFFPGCFGAFHDRAAEFDDTLEVLRRNVARVVQPDWRCCGVSKLSKGAWRAARPDVEYNLARLQTFVEAGYDVVFSAPSCALAVRKEYPRIFGGEAARRVSLHSFEIMEYLDNLALREELNQAWAPVTTRVVYHEPCHGAALEPRRSPAALLAALPGVEVAPMADTCCGIAGTFGMATEHAERSLRIGAPLFREIAARRPAAVVTGCGTCKIQIEAGTSSPVRHPVSLLAEAYRRAEAARDG